MAQNVHACSSGLGACAVLAVQPKGNSPSNLVLTCIRHCTASFTAGVVGNTLHVNRAKLMQRVMT